MTAQEQTVTAKGVKLHTVSEGRGHPVVLLHGFTGTARSTAYLAGGLRDAHRAIRGGCTESARRHAVDPVCAAVAEHAQPRASHG